MDGDWASGFAGRVVDWVVDPVPERFSECVQDEST
jgi:hypothetical protein